MVKLDREGHIIEGAEDAPETTQPEGGVTPVQLIPSQPLLDGLRTQLAMQQFEIEMLRRRLFSEQETNRASDTDSQALPSPLNTEE